MTLRMNFEQELTELSEHIREMGVYVEEGYDRLFDAIAGNHEEKIIQLKKNDRMINDMERQIESKCLSLITRQQPVARDLRRVSAALKVVTDMERVGDHVVDIAELMLRIENRNLREYSESLLSMVEAAGNALHESVEAFVSRNVQKAERVVAADDVIDDFFNMVKMDIIEDIKTEQAPVDACIDILMLNKYLEKIGDHAVNIAEWAIFQETGNMENVRLL